MGYKEVVEALREAPDDWYDADLHYTAADAIEELSTQLADKDRLIKAQWDEIQHLRAEVMLQQDKMIELAKKLPRQCKECKYFYFGFCHKRDGYVKFGACDDRDWFCGDAEGEKNDGL